MSDFNYIKSQLSAISGEGQTRIKLVTDGQGQTNFINITKDQLAAIACALSTPRLVCSPDWTDFREKSKSEPDLTWGQYCERFKPQGGNGD